MTQEIDLAGAEAVLAGAVERRVFPGAVVAAGRGAGGVRFAVCGQLGADPGSPRAGPDTIYDLASLTKAMVTTTMAMILVDEGRLDLTAPVARVLPQFTGGGREKVTARDLLAHASGLPAWQPLFRDAAGPADVVARAVAAELEAEPGTRSVYSDIGFIVLGEVLTSLAGEGLETFARRRILGPLGLRETRFRPGAELRPRIAPTTHDPGRGRLLHGEVQDENAFAMGGVAPHAGLFGTAEDVARFASTLLRGGLRRGRRLVSAGVVELFTRPAGVPGSTWALGWDTRSRRGSTAGDLLSPRAFGHLGFAGTSLWIDPEYDLFVALLANRVRPTPEDGMREVRRAVADAVARAFGVRG